MSPHLESTSSAFAPSSRLGRFIVLSGTLGTDSSGRVVAGGIQAQARQALDNLREQAERAGASLDRAVKVNVFLRQAADFAAMNAVYSTIFTTDPPARTTVVTGLRDPEALVEMAMVLAAPGEPREVVHPPAWKRSPNPYSYGIRSGDTLFLAGLVSRRGTDNSPVAGDMAVQTRAVLDNAAELLDAGGMSFGDVVSSRVYITGAAGFGAMNETYRTAFPVDPPVRATVCVDLMSPEMIVEISFVAVKDAARRVIGPASPLPLSPAVLTGGRLYVSGMLGNMAETAGDAVAQTKEMMARIGRTLDAGGHAWSDVREALLYVTDMHMRDGIVAEMARSFPGGLPAGLVIETGLVAPDGLVELMVTAAR